MFQLNPLRCPIVLFWVLIGTGAMAVADEPNDQSGKLRVDPKALAILKDSSEYVSQLDGFRVQARAALKLTGLSNTEVACEKTIRVQRPNKLAILTKPVMMFGAVSVYCDGKSLYALRLPSKRYTVKEAPGTLAEMVKGLPSTDLLGMDIEKTLLTEKSSTDENDEDTQRLAYLGTDDLDGTPCHHLQVVNDDGQFEMWIQSGDHPVMRRIRGDMSDMITEEDDEFLMTLFKKATYELNLTDWDFKPAFDDDDFAFSPPAGAKKVDSSSDETAPDRESSSPKPDHGSNYKTSRL